MATARYALNSNVLNLKMNPDCLDFLKTFNMIFLVLFVSGFIIVVIVGQLAGNFLSLGKRHFPI